MPSQMAERDPTRGGFPVKGFAGSLVSWWPGPQAGAGQADLPETAQSQGSEDLGNLTPGSLVSASVGSAEARRESVVFKSPKSFSP